ncbi:transporter substrate-binding domain-containing protein [Aldersonia sp. NBC_00410]|uniref:transporter substrate-binding domain-containing protein n=1 Tax=Aldersonia sp. NBC_00410 TaxID=2975954 RepID=UPI0022521CB5|nr:transporter substrate-binding domain-containing protein [Aldersonia sp. NBC_00410]MCX5041959.1 transporter substrate-binding domain-containing protein [Aldersonia sp. NBC_00410]
MTPSRPTGRRILTGGALAMLLLLSGCAEFEAPPAPNSAPTTFAPPLPARATEIEAGAPASATAQPDCGDPTASLRPDPDPALRVGPTIDAIRARGRLVVGLDTGSNLFSFRDPQTGTIQGFDVDIAREIARDLLGDPNLIEYRTLGSADREEALMNHTVDIVAKTMTITCARRQHIDFSTVYYKAAQRVLAIADGGTGTPSIDGIGDLADRRVCVVNGTTSMQHIQQYQPAAALLTVPNWADCMVALQQRQVDAISSDDSILAGLAVQDPYTRVVGDPISAEPYGIGIAQNQTDLVRFVNATLDRIRTDGTWNALYDRWLTVLGPAPGPPAPRYLD